MTLIRIWRTEIDVVRADDYERFAQEQSLPMFKAQLGFEGVLFARRGSEAIVISLWRDAAAVAALDESPTYESAVRTIGESGYLVGDSTVELFDLHGGALGTVDAALLRPRRRGSEQRRGRRPLGIGREVQEQAGGELVGSGGCPRLPDLEQVGRLR